ncbi:hypothetical protein [Burkholderia sp. 3C]
MVDRKLKVLIRFIICRCTQACDRRRANHGGDDENKASSSSTCIGMLDTPNQGAALSAIT